jgi:hypothetical protein
MFQVIHFVFLESSITSKSILTTVMSQPNDQLLAVTICNHADTSGFNVMSLDLQVDSEISNFQLDKTFMDVWPSKDQTDPKFGNITATAPVNSNHLAIGYGKYTKRKLWSTIHSHSLV